MRPRVALLALLLPLASLAMPTGAFHEDALPLVFSERVAGNAAWGARVSTAADGTTAIDLQGEGPNTASQISGGAFFLDAQGNVRFGFGFTGHLSPNRLVLSPQSQGTPPPGVSLEINTHATDAECTYFCLGLTSAGPAGLANYILWMGGVSATTLEVRSDAGASVATRAGVAHVLGDPEIRSGSPNVQVQQGLAATGGVGVKVMQDAKAPVVAKDRLYGFWGASDFKLACQFALGFCIWKSSVDPTINGACRSAGVDCSQARISWDGPHGGGSGSTIYAYSGTPAGAYSFNVDLKLDAYATRGVFEPVGGTFVLVAENYSYLTVADAALP